MQFMHLCSVKLEEIQKTHVEFLVSIGGNHWAKLLGGIDNHQQDRQARIKFVLHHVNFLRTKIGNHTSTENIWPSDTCFIVEEFEPKIKLEMQ